MPLEYTVESLDTVEDGLRGAYVESEGKYQLDPDKYHEIKAAGLKKKINEKIELEKKLKTELSRFEKFKDIDTDLLEQFIEQSHPPEDPKQPQAKGVNVDRVKTRYEAQLQEKDQELATLKAQVREFSIWTPVRDLATKAGVLPDRVEAFIKLLKTDSRFDLNDAGQLVFKESDGYVSDHKPDKAFTVLREEYPYFFQASGASGSGAQAGSGSGTYQKIDYSKLSPVERINAARRQQVK